jgi:hypothetical protein
VNVDINIAAFFWGAGAGYLMLRAVESSLAIVFSLHGLLLSRWKWLKNTATPGQIANDIILSQLLKAGILGILFTFLLVEGDNLMWGEFRFSYHGQAGVLWALAAGIIALFFVRKSWRKLVVVWKLTHEVGYAKKRQRTVLLRH